MDCVNAKKYKEITIESVSKILDSMKDEYILVEIEDLSEGLIRERFSDGVRMKFLDDIKFTITLRSNTDEEKLLKKLEETKCNSIYEYMNKWMKNEIK